MEIASLQISGFKNFELLTQLRFSAEDQPFNTLNDYKNKRFFLEIILGVVFGFDSLDKNRFRGNPSLNKTFTGLITLKFDQCSMVIERDFETDLVACLITKSTYVRPLFQGKDYPNNGHTRPYLDVFRSLFPRITRKKIIETCQLKIEENSFTVRDLITDMNTLFEGHFQYTTFKVFMDDERQRTENFNLRRNLQHPLSQQSELTYLYNIEEVNHRRFFDFFENAPDAVCLWALTKEYLPGVCLEANPETYRLIGYDKSELSDIRLQDILIGWETVDKFDFQQALKKHRQVIRDSKILSREGKQFLVRISSYIVSLNQKDALLTVFSNFRMDDQYQNAEKFSQENYEALVENIPHAVLLISTDRIIECNKSAEKLFLSKKDGIIGRKIYEFSHFEQKDSQDSQATIQEHLMRVLNGESLTFEWRYNKLNGSVFDADVHLDRIQQDDNTVIQAVIRDISNQKRIDHLLYEKQQQYESFFSNTLVGIWRVEFPEPIPVNLPSRTIAERIYAGGFVADCNDALKEMYSIIDPDEILGKSIADFSIDKNLSLDRLEVFAEKNFYFEDVDNEEKDSKGRIHHFRNSYSGFIQDGRLIWIWGIQIDITELKQLEAQFLQSQKMEAIGLLAGGIAHDFNNLLTVINGYSELISKKIDIENPIYKNVSAIRRAGERASNLTGQLLSFSRKQILQPRVILLDEIIRRIIGMIKRLINKNIEIETRLYSELGRIKIDPVKMEQIIMNLAVNARDAMPQGGSLLFETKKIFLDESNLPHLSEIKPGEYIRLSVIDTGIGMEPEIQAHVFEPFFTTKNKAMSTGLGLATVYGIVKQSGGHIDIISSPGNGTEFKIYLPCVDEELSEDNAIEDLDLEQSLNGQETILVVEDDENVRQVIADTLESYGYHALEANDGEEALQTCVLFKEKIDLIITDMVMPRLNGTEFIKRLKPIRPQSKILLMSGYTELNTSNPQISASDIGFIQKPFNLIELARKIRAVLDNPS